MNRRPDLTQPTGDLATLALALRAEYGVICQPRPEGWFTEVENQPQIPRQGPFPTVSQALLAGLIAERRHFVEQCTAGERMNGQWRAALHRAISVFVGRDVWPELEDQHWAASSFEEEVAMVVQLLEANAAERLRARA